ncbi:hypothetical protein G3578_09530 [Brevibacillus sp. SYP-B805]|uniref:hypothetical protein n=1 Tax=Brevibacillus sp. SYP-B805 TaxID=1578199 RepID=UPI0013EAB5E8|nr:hypothetical protein [Brevibacillus sp. SYP-B805]NGQ95395.1 hypothetical protein [Brevibacillus sp. SYP-B805]
MADFDVQVGENKDFSLGVPGVIEIVDCFIPENARGFFHVRYCISNECYAFGRDQITSTMT